MTHGTLGLYLLIDDIPTCCALALQRPVVDRKGAGATSYVPNPQCAFTFLMTPPCKQSTICVFAMRMLKLHYMRFCIAEHCSFQAFQARGVRETASRVGAALRINFFYKTPGVGPRVDLPSGPESHTSPQPSHPPSDPSPPSPALPQSSSFKDFVASVDANSGVSAVAAELLTELLTNCPQPPPPDLNTWILRLERVTPMGLRTVETTLAAAHVCARAGLQARRSGGGRGHVEHVARAQENVLWAS